MLATLRTALHLSTAAVALSAMPAAAQLATGTNPSTSDAAAPTQPSGEPDAQLETRGLEDVVVTARRRTENIQDVSSAVSALSGSELARRFDVDVRGFANASPNIIIDDTQQGPGGVAAISIRGIGVADVEKSVDPAVGVVLDDIYLGTSSGDLIKAIDVDRVEVLRGPQGTLFGRNAIGGIINVARSRPTQDLTAKLRASYGNYNSLNLEGLVSGGLAPWAAVKLTAAHRSTDGYIRNAVYDRDGQRSRFDAIGGELLLTPTPNLEISGSYDYQHTRQDPPQLQNLAKPSDLFCAVYKQCAQGVGVPQSGDRYVSVSDGRLDKNAFFTMNLATAKVKYDLGSNLDLQYIFGYMHTNEGIYQDFDATPLTLYHTDRPAKYHQTTHEVRLTKGGGGPFTFVMGGYYWDSAYRINLVSYIGFAVPGVIIAIPQTVRQTTKSYAAYFEGDYRITPELKLTVGARYTHDKKTSGVEDANIHTLADPVEKGWSKFTPKASLSYNFTPDVMAYGLYSRGYRSGGFNGRPTTVSTATVPYDPETVDNFEGGFKTEFLDRTVRFNIDAFYMKYKNKQEDVDVPAPIGTGRENRTVNAASAVIKGVEADLAWRTTRELTLSGNIGYLDAKYDKFLADTNNDGVVDDNSNLKLRRAPHWTFTTSANYTVDIGRGSGWLQADLHYIGPHEITFLNNPYLHNDGQFIFDGSLNYKIGGTQISAYTRNLFNEKGWTIGYDVQGLWSYGAARPPREYGIALTQTF